MRTSQQINELATALAKARAEFTEIKKNREAQIGNQKYKYAEFDALLEATTPALSKHGLFFTQDTTLEDGALILRSMLMHSSGQWMETGGCPIYVDHEDQRGNAMQQLGKSHTYARRYDAGAILGVCPESDSDAAGGPESGAVSKPSAKGKAQKSDKDPAEFCTYGKNSGTAWASMSDPQLRFYAEDKREIDPNALAVWNARNGNLMENETQNSQAHSADEFDDEIPFS